MLMELESELFSVLIEAVKVNAVELMEVVSEELIWDIEVFCCERVAVCCAIAMDC